MEFRYTQRSLEETPKPCLVVNLRYGDRAVPVLAVVDSGADYSCFHVAHARRIGFDTDKARPIEAVGPEGQPFGCWLAADLGLEIEVGDRSFPFRGVLVESDSDVLGRRDFFLHFRVTFVEQEYSFALEALEHRVE